MSSMIQTNIENPIETQQNNLQQNTNNVNGTQHQEIQIEQEQKNSTLNNGQTNIIQEKQLSPDNSIDEKTVNSSTGARSPQTSTQQQNTDNKINNTNGQQQQSQIQNQQQQNNSSSNGVNLESPDRQVDPNFGNKGVAVLMPVKNTDREKQNNLHQQVKRQIMMDHGSDEGCKILKGKTIEFIVHCKQKKYVLVQFGQTNYEALQEGKVLNILYKRLDQKSLENNSSDGEFSISDEHDRNIYSEESLNSDQHYRQVQFESIFPNFTKETSFIFKKKSTPNGLVLDQVVYSDKIIDYMGHKVQDFQVLTSTDGPQTILHGRDSFYSMMKIVQKQANQYLQMGPDNYKSLEKEKTILVLKTKKQALIQSECAIECRLIEGSFFVKIDILKTLTTNYDYNEENIPKGKEYTENKLERFSPDQLQFIRKYIQPIPDNQLDHNKDKICGVRYILPHATNNFQIQQKPVPPTQIISSQNNNGLNNNNINNSNNYNLNNQTQNQQIFQQQKQQQQIQQQQQNMVQQQQQQQQQKNYNPIIIQHNPQQQIEQQQEQNNLQSDQNVQIEEQVQKDFQDKEKQKENKEEQEQQQQVGNQIEEEQGREPLPQGTKKQKTNNNLGSGQLLQDNNNIKEDSNQQFSGVINLPSNALDDEDSE